MKAQTQTTGETLTVSREKLALLVSQIFGGTSGNPNPDEPLKPGPWDPLIRQVANRVFGPHPEPWRSKFDAARVVLETIAARHPEIFDVVGGDRFNIAELNPQPLPPRSAFLAAFAEAAIDRVLLMQEVADAINQTGAQRGIIIVGGRISELVDELCGNNFKIKIPIPHPKHEADDRLSGLELIVAGAVFGRNAATVANENLRRELSNAGARLIETGLARM